MLCSSCNADLTTNHILEDKIIPTMSNKSRIINPKCSLCGQPIKPSDIPPINLDNRVLLLTGTAGAGKTALGQLIESKSNYIFIDGDAIQKKVNFFARQDPSIEKDYQKETIETMLILLALGYNVVVGYIINKETYKKYEAALFKYNVKPIFRVLVPDRATCLKRDAARDCWTAGEKWVDAWHDEMQLFRNSEPSICIDNTDETLEETFDKHFADLL
jgi:gluconate kinase